MTRILVRSDGSGQLTAKERGVAVAFDAGELLVVKRLREGRRYAVLPGGGVEKGERHEEAALRELAEETGLDGRVVEHLWTIDHEDRTAHYFLVSVKRQPLVLGGPEVQAQSERNQYLPAWVDPADLDELNLQPEELRRRIHTLAARIAG